MRMRQHALGSAFGLCLVGLVSVTSEANAAPRDVQIRSVDLGRGVVELFNFGAVDVDLSGWRFCTHDDDQGRRYTSPGGLDGRVIEAGTSLRIHFANDQLPGLPDDVNIAPLGSFAEPLDSGPYAMQLYFAPVSFGNGETTADHLQWSVDGVDNATADERSDEAESGGVWTDQSSWIVTAPDSERIRLLDSSGGELHGPDDYEVAGPVIGDPPAFNRGDSNDDGGFDLADGSFIFNFLFTGGAAPGCLEAANANGDQSLDLSDGVFILNRLFVGGPPPPPPGPPSTGCGRVEGGLGCESYTSCES